MVALESIVLILTVTPSYHLKFASNQPIDGPSFSLVNVSITTCARDFGAINS